MSLVVDVAEALVSELNASTFTPAFIARRHYRPLFELADLKALHVSVVPRGIEIASLGRNVNEHEVSIDVAVQKAVDPADHAALDALMELVQEIADFLRLRRLAAMPQAIWSRTENVPVFAPEHLEQMRVFTSVLTLGFTVVQ